MSEGTGAQAASNHTRYQCPVCAKSYYANDSWAASNSTCTECRTKLERITELELPPNVCTVCDAVTRAGVQHVCAFPYTIRVTTTSSTGYPKVSLKSSEEYPKVSLPTDPQTRKNLPIATGVLGYFPLAVAYVSMVSKVGNDQHNPGEKLRWAREKSTDHADCITRHLIDRGTNDTDGLRHSGKLAWRALANLETELEAAVAAGEDPWGTK